MNTPDFLKEEYLTLRKEVEVAVAELAALERNAILAIAAIYSWLIAAKFTIPLASLAWSIPLLISLFSALRSFNVGQHLQRLSAYIKKIEIEVAKDNQHATGWEHFHSEQTKNKGRTKITVAFWVCLISVTLIVSIMTW
ncbi:hypothetical protein [Pseudomonas chlororaphis]|uniref:hypothetical protein n=1 Tax=Pseudomonas chlororaphis TaxID=587753 RepID=UPI001472E50D|nr:hypothetical protein [Pseudomonas chlororaphis]NNB43294.1 hypothetical protein [Pseudomonas chlororaphis]